jgi:hypothetical protein
MPAERRMPRGGWRSRRTLRSCLRCCLCWHGQPWATRTRPWELQQPPRVDGCSSNTSITIFPGGQSAEILQCPQPITCHLCSRRPLLLRCSKGSTFPCLTMPPGRCRGTRATRALGTILFVTRFTRVSNAIALSPRFMCACVRTRTRARLCNTAVNTPKTHIVCVERTSRHRFMLTSTHPLALSSVSPRLSLCTSL